MNQQHGVPAPDADLALIGGDGVIVVDPERRILGMGATAERITGWSAADATGRDLAEVLRPVSVREGEPLSGKAERVLASSQVELEPSEVVLRRPDGSEVRVLEGAGRLDGADGAAAGAYVLLRDADEIQHDERRRLQVAKMDALQQFSGGLAHNVNNLLAGIMGYAELILHQRKRDTVATYVGKINDTVERAAALMQQMLIFARLGPFRPETVDLLGLVREATQRLRDRLPGTAELDTRLELEDGRLELDPQQLRTALDNLLVHVADYLPADGRIAVTVAPCADAAVLRAHELDERCSWVELTVSDNGPGLPTADSARIFEPFFASVESGRDPGLDLACVHGIVGSHEGRIVCDSRPGAGTTFRIFLPRSRLVTTTAAGTTTSRFETATGFGTVFLVEDDENLCESLSANLKHMGYRVRVAADGESALAIFREEHDSIDVVVLDVHLPGVGGEQVFAGMQAVDPEVSCVLLTGHSHSDAVQRLQAMGVREVFYKPVPIARLREAIDEVMDFG